MNGDDLKYEPEDNEEHTPLQVIDLKLRLTETNITEVTELKEIMRELVKYLIKEDK